ncbi:MAG TPA: hypothetical protein PKN43_09000 [Agitococcus sp.]|nr:hypothetical protein [Agitococcus sp.]
MGLLASLIATFSQPSYAKVHYDLKNTQQIATINKDAFSNKLLDIMHKVSTAKKRDLTRGDVLTALIENQLLGEYAVKRFGVNKLVENNKVVFHQTLSRNKNYALLFKWLLIKSLLKLVKN